MTDKRKLHMERLEKRKAKLAILPYQPPKDRSKYTGEMLREIRKTHR
jgi:hypothetical protein